MDTPLTLAPKKAKPSFFAGRSVDPAGHCLVLLACLSLVACNLPEAGEARLAAGEPVESEHAASTPAEPVPESIELSTNVEEALDSARASKQPVVLVFDAGWCAACREFNSRTLSAPEIREVASRFRWVEVDIDRNLSLARAYGVQASPSIHLVDPEGNTRVRIRGAMLPEEFRAQLDDFLSDLTTNPRWREAMPVSDLQSEKLTPLTWAPDSESYRGHSICFANVGYGPLHLASQSPFQALRLGLLPRTPSTLAHNDMELRLGATWVNIFADEPDEYLLDYESLRTDVAFAYGLTDTIQLELGLVNSARFGGVMDGFIEGFHDAFGLDQGGRTERPRNDVAASLSRPDGKPPVTLDSSDKGFFVHALSFTAQHNVTCGTDWIPAISYSATLQTDLGSNGDLEGGSVVDVGASVAVSKRFADFYLYGSFGAAWFGDETFRGIPLRSTQLTGLAAAEWRFIKNLSLIAQYLATEGVAEDLGPLSKLSHEVGLGFKWEFVASTVLELGLIENLVTFDNSPDFGVHIGLNARF